VGRLEEKIIELRRFRRDLLSWFDASRRDLPWRRDHDPYRIWVSEAMLQQTRVEVVRPRYVDFISRYPTVRSLADADLDGVLAAWTGLGYYSRARNLHATARIIVRDHAGVFPRELRAALALPGVGPYMSRAVLSIAYGVPVAVVDGNVLRALSRILLLGTRSPAQLQKEADRFLDPDRPGDANEALMELGATICAPTSPRCDDCPVRRHCGAQREGRVADFPTARSRSVRSTRLATTIWIAGDRTGRFWLERRTRPPLRGLWMFPWRNEPAPASGSSHLGTCDHAIMNHRYRCDVRLIRGGPERIPGEAAGPGEWIERSGIPAIPHPSLLSKALRVFDAARSTSAGGAQAG